MLASLNQADQNASCPGLETVMASSGMYRWRTSLSLGIFPIRNSKWGTSKRCLYLSIVRRTNAVFLKQECDEPNR
jgi:hypothetical protein